MKIQKINKFFGGFAEGMMDNRAGILFIFVSLVVLSFMGLKKIQVESSFNSYFLEDDPMLIKTDEFKEIFGNDNFVAVMTECDNTFTKDNLALIRDLSNELMDSLSYADKITSLTDIEFMTGTDYGMKIEQIVPEVIPEDTNSLEAIKKKAFSKPNIARKLISKDGKFTFILLKLRTFPEDSVWTKAQKLSPEFITGQQTQTIISKDKYAAINPKATGMPFITYSKQVYFGKEMKRVMGLAILIAMIVLIFATKSLKGVIVPILTSFCAIIIVYGLLGHLGGKIDSGMMSIPILLSFAVAIAYNIHIFSYFKRQFRFFGKRKKAIIATLEEMGWPLLFSSLTTMAALLTFIAMPLKPLRMTGIIAAGCVLTILLMVIFVMPILMSYGKDKEPDVELQQKGGHKLDRIMGQISDFVLSHPKSIIVSSIFITVLCLIGITKVTSAFDVLKTMGRGIPYVSNLIDITESEIGSLYAYDLLIEFPHNGQAKQPKNLRKLDQITKYVEGLQLTKRTTSILDIIKDLNKTINENQEKYYAIPDDPNQIAQLLLLYENAGGTESEYWIDYDYKRLRLMTELEFFNSGIAEEEMKILQAEAEKIFPNANVTLVGSIPQFVAMMQYVVKGQIQSFLIALVVIAFLLTIVFGKVKIGLIGMIPNIAPALAVGGVMGFFDIPLDMMTATIIPMILGLAVDDTIHFINHGHLEFNRKGNYQRSIRASFKVVGVALVLSSIVISANFLVYTTSAANNLFHLGILAVVGICAALISDLFITPVLFKHFKIFGEETNEKQLNNY